VISDEALDRHLAALDANAEPTHWIHELAPGTFDKIRKLTKETQMQEDTEVDVAPATQPMDQYQSHKKVWAGKIERVEALLDKGATLHLAGGRTVDVSDHYLVKHLPKEADLSGLIGGYFVNYADGYLSWSPAAAFEEGYTLLHSPDAFKEPPDDMAAGCGADAPPTTVEDYRDQAEKEATPAS
jgi:hypothetical protein